MKKLLFLLCVLWGWHVQAQDTLAAFIKKVPHDTTGVRTLIAAADQFSLQNGEKSLLLGREALAIAREVNQPKLLVDALLTVSNRLVALGEYPEATDLLFEASNLADSVDYLGGRIRAILTTGNLYAYQEQHDEALKYYKQALPLVRQAGQKSREATIFNNIGVIYYSKSARDSSLFTVSKTYFDTSYTKARAISDTVRMLTAMNNIAMVCVDLEDYSYARRMADSVISLSELIRDTADLAYGYSHLARIHLQTHQYDSAIECFTTSIRYARIIGELSSASNCYEGLSNAYAGKGDYRKAWEYHVKYFALNDSLVNESNVEIVTDLKNRIITQKKDSEIKDLQQKNEITTLENQRQNFLLVSSGGGLLLLGVLAWLMFSRARSREKMNLILSTQNEVISQKNKDITDSINYAKRIQTALLGSRMLFNSQLKESFILYKPKDIVSGDFWWCALKNDFLYFAVADCTGHGVPGAFMSLLNINLLHRALNENPGAGPAFLLNEVRRHVIDSLNREGQEAARDGMDVVLCALHVKSGLLEFACANNTLILVRNGQLAVHGPDKFHVGLSHGEVSPDFTNHQLQLLPGDTIYLSTDGFPDQFGGDKGKKFKVKQLRELLLLHSDAPMGEQEKMLDSAFERWKGNLEQVDDVLVMGFRW